MSDMLSTELKERPPPSSRAVAMSGKRVFVAALASLAGLLLYRTTLTAPEALRPDVEVSAGLAVTADMGAPTSSGLRVTEARIRVPDAVAIGQTNSLRADFERTPDLYGYVQALALAVRAGEPDALWMVSRVYDYCAGYAASPADYARDTQMIDGLGLRTSAAIVAARNRISQRCARFQPEDKLSRPLILVQRVEAAQAGSVAAEAALLAMDEPLKDSEEYKRDLVQRVQRSKDPESYSALSSAMGMRASGQLTYSDQVAGTQFAELAWQLAACQLGLDCGPDSALMTSYCATGGICSQDAGQDFKSFVFDAAIPRQGAEVVNEMVDSLLSGKKVEDEKR